MSEHDAAPTLVGLDVGGSAVKLGALTPDGERRFEDSVAIDGRSMEAVFDEVVERLEREGIRPAGYGVGVPGLLDRAAGRIVSSPNLSQLEGVDLREGLDETLLLLAHRMRDITVERRYEPVPLITARPGELNQVWTNLIVNAVQVMEGRGTLEVVTDAPSAGTVRVAVIDSGPGIAPDDVERLFDLSFTTKQGRVDFGLGLGLRIAQDIVTRHRGTIAIESKPGRTCFAVTLPVGQTGRKEAAE